MRFCEGWKARNDEQTVEWHTNRRVAEKAARQNADGDYESTITEVDVPTDRAGLLAFLNEHVWR